MRACVRAHACVRVCVRVGCVGVDSRFSGTPSASPGRMAGDRQPECCLRLAEVRGRDRSQGGARVRRHRRHRPSTAAFRPPRCTAPEPSTLFCVGAQARDQRITLNPVVACSNSVAPTVGIACSMERVKHRLGRAAPARGVEWGLCAADDRVPPTIGAWDLVCGSRWERSRPARHGGDVAARAAGSHPRHLHVTKYSPVAGREVARGSAPDAIDPLGPSRRRCERLTRG